MSEYVPVLGTLLGAVAGFGGAYLLDRRRYRREDEEKLYEKVYGELYPILLEARRRYEPAELKSKHPSRFLLKPKEIVQIEAIF